MYLIALYLHVLFISIFTIYILIDRIYIRNFVNKINRENFYKKFRFYLLFDSILILISGVYLLFKVPLTAIIHVKILTASLLFYGFFNCPFYMRKQKCEIRKFMYRFGVLILLLVCITLGLYIWYRHSLHQY